MPLVKKPSTGGYSTRVILDKRLLKMAELKSDWEVEMRVEGNTIVLAPHCYATEDAFRQAKQRVIQANRRALSRLASSPCLLEGNSDAR